MKTIHPIHVLLVAAALASLATLAWAGGGVASAQDDGATTSTTQLDIEGGEGSTTTAPAESTSTTQLDIGGGESSTTTAPPEVMSGSTAGQSPAQAPTRVDAGAGGTAASPTLPLAGVVLAGGLVIVVGAATLRMRRDLSS